MLRKQCRNIPNKNRKNQRQKHNTRAKATAHKTEKAKNKANPAADQRHNYHRSAKNKAKHGKPKTMALATTIQFLFFMFITVSQATPHHYALNVSEVMMARADDLKTAAEIISTLQIDNELTVPSTFTLFIPVDAAFT
ncbi:hypothetical protein QL285_056932 [Trifolium repens]|jgi:hypothetical protein|nr:hypothetical protein QL285_056932 [Trifolium repens]